MKKFIYLFVIGMYCHHIVAQTSPPSQQWVKTVRGQFSSPFEEVVKSTKDNFGNIYVLCQDYINIYVVKYNSSGAIVNVMTYNGSENNTEYAFDLKLLSDGSVVVGTYEYNNSFHCPAVIKFNASGVLDWKKLFPGSYTNSNKVKSVSVDVFDNIHFCGSFNDSTFAGKINAAGSVLWKKTFAPGATYSTGVANAIASDDNGISYVAGKSINAAGNYDFFVTKFSATGLVQWNKTINGFTNSYDEALFIKLDNNYNCYVAGLIADTSATNKTATVVKYNAAGGQQWVRKLFQPGVFMQDSVNIQDFHLDNQGNSYLALKEDRAGYNYANAKVLKLSALGTLNWTKTYTGNGLEQNPYAISTDNTGNVYVCGTEQLPAGADVFVLKYDALGNNVFSSVYEFSPMCYETAKTITIDNSNNIYVAITFNFTSQSKQDVGLVKFNSASALQFESLYDAPISSISQGKKLLLENNSIHVLGGIINNGSKNDIAVSNFDDQGYVQWQNVIDYEAESNYPMDMVKKGSNIYVVGTENTGLGSVIVKYDSIGSLVWTDTLAQCLYSKVAVKSNGQPVFAGEAHYNYHEKDFRIAIYNPTNGNVIYQNTPSQFANFGSNVNDLTTDPSDNIYAFGYTRYIDPVLYTNNYIKIKLQKFNSSGLLQWTKEISGLDSSDFAYTNAHKVITDANSNIYVFASAKVVGSGNVQSIIAKYAPNGNLLWRQNYALSSLNEALSTSAWSNNGFIYTVSKQQNGAPVVIRKINPLNGNVIFVQTPAVYPFQLSYNGAMALDSLNNIFYTSSAFLSNSNVIFIAKYDSSGTNIWQSGFDGAYTGNDDPNDIKVTNTGRIYILASAVMSNYGNIPDITLIKLCDIPKPSIVSTSTNIGLCPGSAINLQTSGGTSYLWNHDNVTTYSILADTAGQYFATVFLNDGCFKNTDTVSVNVVLPQTPDICMVTVDSLSINNEIYWEKALYANVDSFIVYREVSSNLFKRIGAVSKNAFSMYTDTNRSIGPANGDPNLTAYKYKLQILDTCGNYSALSLWHQTIFVQDQQNGNFNWNAYAIESSTSPVSNYNLKRRDQVTGVETLVGSTTSNLFTDPQYSTFWPTNTKWLVDAIGFNCNPTQRVTAQKVKTKSNHANDRLVTKLKEINFANDIMVYPNPAKSIVNIEFGQAYSGECKINVTDVLGKLVYTTTTSQKLVQINTEELLSGVYFIDARQQGKTVAVKKLIIE